MIPVNIDSHLDIAVVSSSSSPGVNVVIKEKHTPIPPVQGAPSSGCDVGASIPPFPALTKTHTMPSNLSNESAQNSRVRKRNPSEEENFEVKNKMLRRSSLEAVLLDRSGFNAFIFSPAIFLTYKTNSLNCIKSSNKCFEIWF